MNELSETCNERLLTLTMCMQQQRPEHELKAKESLSELETLKELHEQRMESQADESAVSPCAAERLTLLPRATARYCCTSLTIFLIWHMDRLLY